MSSTLHARGDRSDQNSSLHHTETIDTYAASEWTSRHHDVNTGSLPSVRGRKLQTIRRRKLQTTATGGSCLSILTMVAGATFILFTFLHLDPLNLNANSYLRVTDKGRNIWVSEGAQPFDKYGLASRAQHLVMVAGHSITVSGHLNDANRDENDWFLLSYQKGQGLPQAIHAHIIAGIQEAQKDPKALLIFSGGETRSIVGPETEAQAYYKVADAMNLWPSEVGSTVRARTTTEEFATDSFENLMFSIARFHEVTGRYPKKITVVSFSFKMRRFKTLHAPALRWPSNRFAYIGVDPPASTGFDLEGASAGELKNSAVPFEGDPYGCSSEVLQNKRKGRNPFKRTPPYALSCPDMKYLLHFCGPELVPEDRVPWVKVF